jgi:hypothetical protein
MKLFMHKIYVWIILLAEKQVTVWDKINYALKLLATFGPIVALLEALRIWFQDNQTFIGGVLVALLLNMGIGMWYHKRARTFSWSAFFEGNIKMFCGVMLVYILLELLRSAAGNTIISEAFKIIVQTTTMLWPVSKSLKNIYIIYEKKFPPAFIMERLYNFEKTGNVKQLFDSDFNNAKE